MARIPIALAASLCIAGSLGQAGGQSVAAPTPVDGTFESSVDPPMQALATFIGLDEFQLTQLQQISFALEDEVFPLMLDSWNKRWQLSRQFRSEHPNAFAVLILEEGIKRIDQQIESAREQHRHQARALLSSDQIEELGRLEDALELSLAAHEAASVNLIEGPEGLPRGILSALFGLTLDLGLLGPFEDAGEVHPLQGALPTARPGR